MATDFIVYKIDNGEIVRLQMGWKDTFGETEKTNLIANDYPDASGNIAVMEITGEQTGININEWEVVDGELQEKS
jgi:hypothetical protein